MVYCYKLITETPRPRRCSSASPRRRSPLRRPEVKEDPDQFHCTLSNRVIKSIPRREWKLLETLARKREETEERDRLAHELKNLWLKEKQEREQAEAEISEQYKRYLQIKRDEERRKLERNRLQRSIDSHFHRGELMQWIQNKEMRSADLLAWVDDLKTTKLVEKALNEDSRAQRAADRRERQRALEEWKGRVELATAEKRVDDARQRRTARLLNASKRAALTNALNVWERNMVRREITSMEAAKRASLLDRLACEDARHERMSRVRDWRKQNARAAAVAAADLRDAVRCAATR